MFKNICWVNWLFTIMVAGLAVISLSIMLSGCGNKGDLTVPDKKVTYIEMDKVKKGKELK